MGWIILVLVLLAAAFGVLGAVLKVAAFLVLTVLLSVVVLVGIGWYVVKYRARRFLEELDARAADGRVHRTRRDGGQLPPTRDDRY